MNDIKFLFSPVAMFTLKQNIYFCHNDNMTLIGAVETWDLARNLVQMCYNSDVFDIKLTGNDDYLNMIIDEITKTEHLSYSANKIKVEKVGIK